MSRAPEFELVRVKNCWVRNHWLKDNDNSSEYYAITWRNRIEESRGYMQGEFIYVHGFLWWTDKGIEDRPLWFWSIFKLQLQEHEIWYTKFVFCLSINFPKFKQSSNTKREPASQWLYYLFREICTLQATQSRSSSTQLRMLRLIGSWISQHLSTSFW